MQNKEPKTGEFKPAKFERREPWRDALPTLPQWKPNKENTHATTGAGVLIKTI